MHLCGNRLWRLGYRREEFFVCQMFLQPLQQAYAPLPPPFPREDTYFVRHWALCKSPLNGCGTRRSRKDAAE